MSIEGRLLDDQDEIYFQTAYTIKVIISVELPFVLTMGYGDKLVNSFRRVVKTSPILQTHVVPCEPHAHKFSLLKPEEWPRLHVYHLHSLSKEAILDEKREVMTTAQTLGDEDLRHYRDNKDAAMTQSCRVHVVLGKKRIALSIVAPHHFCDGAALGTILVKLICYSFAPRPLWPILDRFSPKKVPTFREMTLQSDPIWSPSQHSKVGNENILTPESSRYFQFKGYNMKEKGASKFLQGFNGDLGVVPASVMDTVRTNLRKENMSISTAFGALAIKVLAILLLKYAPELNAESLPLLLTIGVDGRQMQKKKRFGKVQCRFPVIANYAFDCFCLVPYLESISSSLGNIAAYAKDTVKKLRSDPAFRAQTISQKPLNDTYDCGVSSVVVSDALLCSSVAGVKGVMIDSAVEFGTMPRVWFYVVSVQRVNTTVSADIKLPINGLNKSRVAEALLIASKGSPLEPLFSPTFK